MSETNYNNFLFQGKQRELLELLVQDYGKEYAQDVLWNLMTSATNGDTCTERQTVKFWVDKLQGMNSPIQIKSNNNISYKLTSSEKLARRCLQDELSRGIYIPIQELVEYSNPIEKAKNFIPTEQFTRYQRLKCFLGLLNELEASEDKEWPSKLIKYTYNESGIYALCKNKNLIYIGSTTRSFQQRAREHYRGIQEYFETKKSALYAYSLFEPEDTINFRPLLIANNIAYPQEQIPEYDLKTMELALISFFQPEGNLAGTSQEFRY